MAEFTQVKADLWEDPEFEELEPAARLLWLDLLTTPTRNAAGLYHMSIRRMAFETGLRPEEISVALSDLERLKWIQWDAATSLVWVRNFVKRQPCGPKLVVKILKELEDIGDHPFVIAFRDYYADTLSIGYGYGIDTDAIPPVRGDGDGDGTGTGRDGDGDVITRLVSLCRCEIPGWQEDSKDRRCVERGVQRLGLEDAERVIWELVSYQEEKPPKGQYKNPRQALGNWFAKEQPRTKGQAASPTYANINAPEGW